MAKFEFSCKGKKLTFPVGTGRTIASELLRLQVPIDTVIVRLNGAVLNELNTILDTSYDVTVVEGFDIESILNNQISSLQISDVSGKYLKRHLKINENGTLCLKLNLMSDDTIKNYVETTFFDTVKNEKLFEGTKKIVFGLSGGVDSTTLAYLLKQIPGLEIHAVTYDDFKTENDPMQEFVKEIAKNNCIIHSIISEQEVRNLFNLNTSIKKILPELMETKDYDKAMYIDHHLTRRALEHYAEQNGIQTIVLGLHATDIIAGLINNYTYGYPLQSMPKRSVGKFTYSYPLCYLTKKELKLYLELIGSPHFKSNKVNPWELNPLDRNFYYYLADNLQTVWPDIQYWLIKATQQTLHAEYAFCENCKGSMQVTSNQDCPKLCDVCKIFKEHGYLKE
ncbi:MAG: ATP-binding protein [Candidatus ainarchaeum sp.]|nr:ATP-binding protein [Candidatus ainarchaeum sp.]